MTNIIDIFEEYGWPGIVVIILIGFIILLIKRLKTTMSTQISTSMDKVADKLVTNLNKQNQNLVEAINQQNCKLIDYIVHNKTAEQATHDEMMNERMDLSGAINEKLKDILNIYNTHRVAVVEFHNSYKNISGVPFAKYSCTYEWLSIGTESVARDCKGESFSTIAGIVKDVIDSGGWQKAYDIEELKNISPTLHYLWNHYGAKSVIYNAMYDNNNIMIGMLILEYASDIPEHIDYEDIKLRAAQISSIISLGNNHK